MIKSYNKTKLEKQRLFVTVGTSIFSNMVNWATQINHPHVALIKTTWADLLSQKAKPKQIKYLVQLLSEEFLIQDKQCHHQASAEIQSIHSIQNHPQWKHIVFDLHLITTDTELSNLSAQMIQFYFQNEHHHIGNIYIKKIKGLQVDHQIHFKNTGFKHLVNYLISAHPDDGIKGLINVTGGYKAVIPVMSIVGQLLEMPITYNYESSDELLIIPAMPLGFDWTYMELYLYFLTDVERKTIVNNNAPPYIERVFDLNKLTNTKLKNFFLKEMSDTGFMQQCENSSFYKSSFLGDLLLRHIEKVYPIAAQNFGLPLEFLFYEYFLNETFQWENHRFTQVKHRHKISAKNNSCEFDFILSTNHPTRKQIVCEITSFGQLFVSNNYKYPFRKQLRQQIDIIKTKQLQVDLYLLLLYGFKMCNNWKILTQGIGLVWKELKKAGIQNFKIMTTDLPISQVAASNNPNVYSAIYQKKISRNKALWAKHQQDTYGNPFLLLKDFKKFSTTETINA